MEPISQPSPLAQVRCRARQFLDELVPHCGEPHDLIHEVRRYLRSYASVNYTLALHLTFRPFVDSRMLSIEVLALASVPLGWPLS